MTTPKHTAPEGENAAVVAFIARLNRRPTTEEFQLYAAGYYDSQGKQQAEGTRPLTSEEREVMREAIRDSAELVAPGRMAVDRSQPVGAGLTDALDARMFGGDVNSVLLDIGRKIGFGRAQQILGDLWDVEHDVAPRGQMGVTVGKCIPPKMWNKRGQDAYRRGWNECAKATEDAALSVPASAPAGERPLVPEGWRLVPVEPTPEMCRAGEINWGDPNSGPWHTYERMVAASPSLPVSGDGKEGQ